MADKKTETLERLRLPLEVRDRWDLIDEDDYPLIMAEYTRKIGIYAEQTSKDVRTIKNFVIFFGVLTIIAIAVSFLNLMLFSF